MPPTGAMWHLLKWMNIADNRWRRASHLQRQYACYPEKVHLAHSHHIYDRNLSGMDYNHSVAGAYTVNRNPLHHRTRGFLFLLPATLQYLNVYNSCLVYHMY